MLALRLSRTRHRLDAKSLYDFAHYALKAHIYKNAPAQSLAACDLLAHWIALSASEITSALSFDQNVFSPNTKISRLLLLANADPNICFEFRPLLCIAAQNGHQDFCSLLLEFGADARLTGSKDGRSALMCAARSGQLDLVQLLHQHGASLRQIDSEGRCALVHAAESGQGNVVSFLLHCDWTTDGESDEDEAMKFRGRAVQQAFVAAAAGGQAQTCRFLMDFAEADANGPDPISGETGRCHVT